MNWNTNLISNLGWASEIINFDEKLKVANIIASKVHDGDVIGFGSGSTSFLAARQIAERVKKDNLSVTAIPASKEIQIACNILGIKTASLNEMKPDWCFDGADEIDAKGNMIKGRGGAMFNEKLVMSSASKTYILADKSKFVKRLGQNCPVPIEINQNALKYVESSLASFELSKLYLRMAAGKDGPIITENGNFILDAYFREIRDCFEKEIKCIPGVIESGLFIGYPVEIIN